MSSMEERYLASRGRARGRSRGTWMQPGAAEERLKKSASNLEIGKAVCQDVTAAQYPVVLEEDRVLSSGDSTSGKFQNPPSYNSEMTRPKHIINKQGESGRRINVAANFVNILSRPEWYIYQYHVDFSPTVESSEMRKSLLLPHTDQFGPCFIFDGMSDLKSMLKLEPNPTLYSTRKTDGAVIKIDIKKTQVLSPDDPEILRLFNTLMKKNLQQLKFILLGKHYFDKETAETMPRYHLEVWQGVVTSIQQYEKSLMLSVDTVHRVLRQDTVLMQMIQIREESGEYRANCLRTLIGSVVITQYNNKTYRINDIEWSMSPRHTFEHPNDGVISFIGYYKKHYDIAIRDGNQPLLVCESKAKEFTRSGQSRIKVIYLIPELCVMTGLTDSMRKDFHLMQDLAQHTRLSPLQRVQSLETFIDRIKKNDSVQEDLDGWGVKFDSNAVEIPARVLIPEKLTQKDYTFQVTPGTGDFQRQIRGRTLHCTAHLRDWIAFFTAREKNKVIEFIEKLRESCHSMGIQMIRPNMVQVKDDKTSSYLEKLEECLTNSTEFVLFVLPTDRKERYDTIKKKVCIETPIPSQVVLSHTISKPQILMSVAHKIALQINSKLGGAPWVVSIPIKQSLMVIGYDAYHDSSRKGNSIGSFVSSLNSSLCKWFSQVDFNKAGEWSEMSDNLYKHLKTSLLKFKTNNGKLPEMIIFYRSGISDGQIKYVLKWEVERIQNTFQEIGNYNPYFAYVIVNKTISIRFFSKSGDRYTNPDPGTIIDDVVTKRERYDFFLVSQSVRQGTVSPTYYNVIFDTTPLKPEHMQRLTYKLTHLYYNWPGTIRMPAPCQYAHKLAFLVGQSLHKSFHPDLSDTLFYL